jgi:hypothetical protein
VRTDAQGRFSVALPAVAVTTQFQAVLAGRAAVSSRVVVVEVLARVGTRVTRTEVRRGGRVRFSGTVRPAEVNRPLAIQRRRRWRWVTVAGMVTRPGRADFTVYGKTIRVRRSGLYRVFVGAGSGASRPNVGRTIRLRIVL